MDALIASLEAASPGAGPAPAPPAPSGAAPAQAPAPGAQPSDVPPRWRYNSKVLALQAQQQAQMASVASLVRCCARLPFVPLHGVTP
jgi:hypothetical protein